MAPDTEAPELSPEKVAQLTTEALRPDKTQDFVELLGKQIPIKFMPADKEDRVVELVLPFLPLIAGMNSDNVEDFGGLVQKLMKAVPQAVAIIAEPELTLEEIRSGASVTEMIPVVLAQLEKYGLQDALGKLSGLVALLKR